MDLTSHTFVDGAIRMIVASILALVLSFGFDFLLLWRYCIRPGSCRCGRHGFNGIRPPLPTRLANKRIDKTSHKK